MIYILPSKVADVRMRMFNPDGSESEMCGNGVRCVAAYAYDRGLCDRTQMTIETGGGIKNATLTLDELGRTDAVRIDMGEPVLDGAEIPSVFEGNPVMMQPLTAEGKAWPVTLVNMSNPHAVTFVDDVETAPVHSPWARSWRMDPAFPRGAAISSLYRSMDRTPYRHARVGARRGGNLRLRHRRVRLGGRRAY